MASLRKAISLKPRLRGANLFLAIAEYRVNHFDKAIAALQKETSYYSSDANAWMWLGVVQLAAENPAEAAAALDKAARLAPDNVDILYHRGRAHLLVSKNSYEKMFHVDPHSWRVHQVLAQADAEADRHEDAIAEYHAAIQIAPKQPGLHEELGTEYIKAGKPELADAEFQQELEIDPNNVLTRYKLGTLETERGQGAKDRKSTRLNSSHGYISYAVFCLKKKKRRNRAPGDFSRITHLVLLQSLMSLTASHNSSTRYPLDSICHQHATMAQTTDSMPSQHI